MDLLYASGISALLWILWPNNFNIVYLCKIIVQFKNIIILMLWCFFDAVPDGIVVTRWTKQNDDTLVSKKIHLKIRQKCIPDRKTRKNTR